MKFNAKNTPQASYQQKWVKKASPRLVKINLTYSGCSCVTLSFNLSLEFEKSDFLRITSDIFGILSENQILHEPIFFHCLGQQGVQVYSQIARGEFLTDFIVGAIFESFELENQPKNEVS